MVNSPLICRQFWQANPSIQIYNDLRLIMKDHHQQQLASTLAFTHWQVAHTTSVSWQLSTQNGMQQQTPVTMKRTKHQIQVTPPGTCLEMLLVSLRQTGQSGLMA
jgi:hypothetical protein